LQSTGAGYTYEYIFSTIAGFSYPDYASPVIHHTFITGERLIRRARKPPVFCLS
jgi:hypothetical protein